MQSFSIRIEPLAQSKVDETTFARFLFAAGSAHEAGDRDVLIRLNQRNPQPLCEVWTHAEPATCTTYDSIRAIENSALMVLVGESGFTDPKDATFELYQRMLSLLDAQTTDWRIVKIWNFVPDINAGAGDNEVYRQFCVGRAMAFDRRLAGEQDIPAATAVGSRAGEPLQVMVAAAPVPTTPVENPRQVSAYRYPRQYGPRSPLFARAGVLNVESERHLFLSGTASIVGHESQSINDADAQAAITQENIATLLGQAFDTPPSRGALRVYARSENADVAACRVAHELVAPDQAIQLEADICRAELLLEMDGWFSGSP